MSETVRALTPEEYLEAEEAAEVRHEYVRGEVLALAGGRYQHCVIAVRLTSLLSQHLDGTPCQVLNSDMKLRAAVDRFYYPDLMIHCESEEPDCLYVERPRYVFEVSSPSTRRIDLGEKADAYWRVSSIEAYVMVSQSEPRVVVQRRGAEDWETEILTQPDDVLRLDGIGFHCTLAAIYANSGLLAQD